MHPVERRPIEPREWAITLALISGVGLFWWLQPLAAERLIIRYGGGAEVWTACLCFFQLSLLLGYLYAHGVSRWLEPRKALSLHALFALVSIGLFHGSKGDPQGVEAAPLTLRIIAHLALELGPAALILSATSPLMQYAHHGLTQRAPWRIHALANLIALALLLIHPFLLEPFVARALQVWIWTLFFALYALSCFGVALCDGEGRRAEVAVDLSPAPPWLWVSLSACASALLMATTEAISRDIASAPLLWVGPLAIFLLSVALTFDSPRLYRRGPVLGVMLLSLAGIAIVSVNAEAQTFELRTTLYLLMLGAGCTLCHGELYRGRPEPKALTRYHLSMALGGALGGLAVTFAAPALMERMAELPLIMALTLLVFTRSAWRDAQGRRIATYGLVALMALGALVGTLSLSTLAQSQESDQRVIERSRNIHGALTLVEREQEGRRARLLVDGNTTHGLQYIGEEDVAAPTLYYSAETGIFEAIRLTQQRVARARVTLIGLGVGTLAAYARPHDSFVFYELNPDVVRMAHQHFTFLAQSEGDVSVEVGDGRLLLSQSPESERLDLLVIDAFSSDAIPTHLLTREAMHLYHARLSPGGLIAFHVTNRTLDLVNVVQALAQDKGLGARVLETKGRTTWVLVGAQLESVQGEKGALWTDDYAPLWHALRP